LVLPIALAPSVQVEDLFSIEKECAMSEIQIVGVNAVVLVVAYFWVYPRFGRNDVNRIASLDLAIGLATLGLLAPFNWGSPNEFTLLPSLDTPWWIFAIVTYTVLEIPLFTIYCARRGLWNEYKKSFRRQ
jgi:hypothetical protein